MGKMNGKSILDSMKIGAVTASFCIEGIGANGLLKITPDEFDKRLDWMHSNHTS